MVLAVKGGGSRGDLECHIPILKNVFFFKKKHLESFPDCENVFLHLVWALYYVYIVVEMTLDMAK